MITTRNLPVTALLLTALAGSGAAGSEVLPFEVLGLAEGLPQSQATAMAQDAEGYIWIGTWGGGLARFNGAGFTVLTDDHGLPSGRIQELLLDRSGRLWIATTRGLARWVDHRIEVVEIGFPDGVRVRALAEDPAGRLWIGTDEGVAVLAEGNPRRLPAGGREPIVHDLLAEPDGVLAVTDRGLLQMSVDGRVEEVEAPAVAPILLRSAARTAEGLWLGTAGEGLFLRDDSGWRQVREEGLPCRNVYRLGVVRSGALFAASQDEGLMLRLPAQRQFEQIGPGQGLPSKLANDAIEDAEGNLWVATDIGGVARLRSRSATVHGSDGSFPSSCVFGIAAGSRPDTLWVATLAGAVQYRARPPFGVVETVTEREGLVDPHVWDVVATPRGEVWVYTESHYQLRRPGRDSFDPPDPSWPVPGTTHGLALDDQGRVWFSGLDGEHPLAMRDGEGRWRSWNSSDDGQPVPDCRSVTPRGAGGVWVSAGADLLACDGRSVRRLPGPPLPPGLTTLLEDSLGRLWVGNAGGLAVREPDGRWRLLGRQDGFTARQVFFLGQDRAGAVWAGVERGVLRFMPDGTVRPFGTADGLAGLETNQFGFHAGPDGEVWLGTVTGMTRFDPFRFVPSVPPPRAVIESVELPSRRVDFPGRLELGWGERSATFHIALLSYRDRDRVGYRARLEGLEDRWLPLTRASELRYTNLPAGRHALMIETLGEDGRVGETVRLPVRVVPPVWRTAWFEAAVLGLLAAAAVGAHRLRVHVLRRRAEDLEHAVADRTDELRRANDELERLASSDVLTGVANRRAIVERLRCELGEGTRRLGCLLVDLDRFKQVNDTFGHAEGDRVLRVMAESIVASVRDGDVVGRYGGDEFLVVLPGADLEGLEAVARRVAALREPCAGGPTTVTVSTSSGGVIVPSEAPRDLAGVLAAADALLYEVKASGRAGFRIAALATGSALHGRPGDGSEAAG